MTNTVIQLRKSSTPSSVPASLEFGELAINYADGKLFYKNTNSQIAEISGSGGPSGGNAFGTVNANGVLVIADAPGDIFTLDPGQNITIVGDAINDKITISAPSISSAFDKANAANVLAFQVSGAVTAANNLAIAAFGQANTARTHANAAFDKANAANVLAFNTGAGANAYTQTVGVAGNSYTNTVGAAGNSYTNTVGTAGNNYTITVGAAGNNWANTKLSNSTTTLSGTLTITGNIELGHVSDTTLARSSAGNITIEGNVIYRAGGTDVPIADGGTGASDAANARINLGLGTFKSNVGNGSANTFNVNHALNSTDVIVSVREISSGYLVYPDIDVTTPNHCVFEFVNAPSANQYRVVILGT